MAEEESAEGYCFWFPDHELGSLKKKEKILALSPVR